MIRSLAGLVLLIGVIAAGFVGRSYWIIGIFALLYTASFASSRAKDWGIMLKEERFLAMLGSMGLALLIQLVLAVLFYFVGFGLGALFGGHDGAGVLVRGDWIFALVFASIGSAAGVAITYLETKAAADSIVAEVCDKVDNRED